MPALFRPLAALLCLPAAVAIAAPDDHVHSPEVTAGELTLEYKLGTYKLPQGEGRLTGGTIGVEVGVNDWWATVMMLGHEKAPGESNRVSGFVSENIFRISKPGSWLVDTGWLVEAGIPRESKNGWSLSTGPLFMKEADGWEFNLNFFYERLYGGRNLTAEEKKASIVYQGQVMRKLGEHTAIGVQAFGDLGPWDNFLPVSKQPLRIGPTVQGEWKLGEHSELKYDFGYLFGTNGYSPDNNFRFVLGLTF